MSSPETEVRRRRLDSGQGERQPKAGCLITGAVLGIIVGATFAFYGLPPILRSIYGEEALAPGETYSADAKEIAVASFQGDTASGLATIILTVRTNKTWDPDLQDIRLEIAGQDDWIQPLPPDPSIPGTKPGFPLAQERQLILRYQLPPGVDTTPIALHLANPRIRFELTESESLD